MPASGTCGVVERGDAGTDKGDPDSQARGDIDASGQEDDIGSMHRPDWDAGGLPRIR